jgi:hypothetical protein
MPPFCNYALKNGGTKMHTTFNGPRLKNGHGFVIGDGAILMRLNYWAVKKVVDAASADILSVSSISEHLPHSFRTLVIAGNAIVEDDNRITGESTVRITTPSGVVFYLYAMEGTSYRPLVTRISR